MNEKETAAPVRAFDRAYINGKFVTPYGTQVGELRRDYARLTGMIIRGAAGI